LGNEWFIFDDLKRIILYVIIGRSLITFIGYLSFYIFGNTSILKGYYGGVKIFTFDPLDYFAAFIILALFSDKGISRSQKILILISWIISIFSFVIFQPFGKSILFLFITLIELIVILLLKQRLLISKILILTVTFISIIAIVYFLDYLSTTNILLSSKYSEVKKFLSFKWIKDPYLLPSSPRDRVLEFYNIIWSHIENPFFLLIGRGIGGYFKDEKFYNYTASEIGGYSLYEVKTRQFYNPHESLNFILLKFGLAGVTFYLFILYKIIKATKRDIFTMNLLLAGFGLFFGYSLKLSILVGWSLYIFLFSTKKYSSDKLFLLQERRLIE
jgi:hypothetical protein